MAEHSNYKGKYFSILGDSISTLEGYSTPEFAAYYDLSRMLSTDIITPSDTWWGQVIDTLGGRLLVNNSFSGSTVSWRPLYEIESYACSDERTSSPGRNGISPDVIMIYMGTNDWGYGTRISGDVDSTECFLPAYRLMLEKLRANYPAAEIWCFTLPIGECLSKDGYIFPRRIGGRDICEYCDAIRTCAKEYGCRLIDLYSKDEPHDTIDGFHPNKNGMKTLADAVIVALSEAE